MKIKPPFKIADVQRAQQADVLAARDMFGAQKALLREQAKDRKAKKKRKPKARGR